jgi:hypothetical protein
MVTPGFLALMLNVNGGLQLLKRAEKYRIREVCSPKDL